MLTLIILLGCFKYTRDLFWKNKIETTPYEAPDSLITLDEWSDDNITYSFILTHSHVDITEPRRELLRVIAEQDRYELVECSGLDSSNIYPDIGVSCVLP